jgi:hypothetical protein
MTPMLLNPNLVAPPSLTFQQEVLADGPLRFYRLNDTSGTSALDISGNAQHGTYVNGVTLNQAGPRDKSAAFSRASSQYVSIPTSGLPSGSSAYTIAGFFKTTVIDANQGFVGFGQASDQQSNVIRLTGGGGINNYWFSNDYTSPNSSFPNATWAHVACTCVGGATNTRTIFVNGVAVGSGGGGGTHNTVFGQAQIGHGLNAEFLDGNAAEIAIFNTAISAARIAAWVAAS